jgi:4-hydroxyphenylpyruvate dioxygenase
MSLGREQEMSPTNSYGMSPLQDDEYRKYMQFCMDTKTAGDACLLCPQEYEASTGDRYLPAIATMSLGNSLRHSLDKKLEAAAAVGFHGIELFWDDLVAYGEQRLSVTNMCDEEFVATARDLKEICDGLKLSIISLQPFRNYDGLTDPEEHRKKIREFKLWISVANELDCSVIGVPSAIGHAGCAAGDYSGHCATLAKDLAELAGIAGPHGIRIAYENLCFGKHVQDWHQAWQVICQTGRLDDIVFLPDAFNLCGAVFADPSVSGGVSPKGAYMLDRSLQELVEAVPVSSMPILQVADAELMKEPLTGDHPWLATATSPKMAWSRNARLFPLEEGGYLPVVQVVKALTSVGWSGWVSLEVFSRTTQRDGDETIWEHATRAWNSWEKLAGEMCWDANPVVQKEW